MKKLYVIHEYTCKRGETTDFESLFINHQRLIKLYKVNPKHCISSLAWYLDQKFIDSHFEVIHLRPRFDGDYRLSAEEEL